MRTCTKCKKDFPASAEYFSPQKRGLLGLKSICKDCCSTLSKRYHVRNPESRVAARLKFKFGMTLEQWNNMFEAQRGCCAICGKHQSALQRRLAVDHNHQTGKIRALLCQNCNHGLGHFYENLASLTNAVSYLEQHAQ